MSEAHTHTEPYLEGFRAGSDEVNPYGADDALSRSEWDSGRLDRATADATADATTIGKRL